MLSLFDKTKIKNMELKNRFFRSATYEGRNTEDGHMTEEVYSIYEDLAKGGVGLIITGYTYITAGEHPSPKMMGVYDDSFIDEYKKLTQIVHSYGTKILLQIIYRGSIEKYLYELNNKNNIGKSLSKDFINNKVKNYVVDNFLAAAERAKKAGFDGIQIHDPHSSLDCYCKDKMVFEIYNSIREKSGDDFHISIKMNCGNLKEDRQAFENCKSLCIELDKLGIDSIEITGPNTGTRKDENFFKTEAAEISKEVDCALILVGGNRSQKSMTDILNSTNIQYFSLCRPLICEPDIITKFKNDYSYEPKCLMCSKCLSAKNRCVLR